MGRYNWALFVLCGFGWFADKWVSLDRQSSVGMADHTAFVASGFR